MENILKKNYKCSLRKFGLKSNLICGRNLYIITNLMMKKDAEALEECFLLL
jgi:hypothetical protein